MRKQDLLWGLAYPLYQLIGSFRHEASHALVAILQGARITEFVFWPTQGYWGHVSWDGPSTVAAIAAPYVCDLITFLISVFICGVVLFRRRWLWINGVILGVISPLVNSLYNYLGGLRGPNDVGWLLARLSPPLVHGYFWVTMGLYLAGLVLVLTVSRTARATWSGA